jgi:hypothetical protein
MVIAEDAEKTLFIIKSTDVLLVVLELTLK